MQDMIIEQIRQEVMGCTRCPELVAFRNKIAFSCGSGKNGVMLVGTAPSYIGGNITGKPMSDGKSRTGALIQEVLDENSLVSDECFNTNILYCSTPYNREPTEQEIRNCLPYTIQEIEIIKPRIVILLGRVASLCFLSQQYKKNTIYYRDNTKYVGMLHPAFVLRQTQDFIDRYKAEFGRILNEARGI